MYWFPKFYSKVLPYLNNFGPPKWELNDPTDTIACHHHKNKYECKMIHCTVHRGSVQWTPDGKKLAKWQGNNFLEMFLRTYMEVEVKKKIQRNCFWGGLDVVLQVQVSNVIWIMKFLVRIVLIKNLVFVWSGVKDLWQSCIAMERIVHNWKTFLTTR